MEIRQLTENIMSLCGQHNYVLNLDNIYYEKTMGCGITYSKICI